MITGEVAGLVPLDLVAEPFRDCVGRHLVDGQIGIPVLHTFGGGRRTNMVTTSKPLPSAFSMPSGVEVGRAVVGICVSQTTVPSVARWVTAQIWLVPVVSNDLATPCPTWCP